MGRGRLAIGVMLVTMVAISIGYVLASAVLTFKDLGFQAEIEFFYIAENYLAIRDIRPDDFRLVNLIMGGAGVAGLLMSLAMSGSALTRFGYTHWQTRREMKRNGFFGKPGTGFGLIAGWFEDYNENHPHSGLKMRSPREFIAAQTATA